MKASFYADQRQLLPPLARRVMACGELAALVREHTAQGTLTRELRGQAYKALHTPGFVAAERCAEKLRRALELTPSPPHLTRPHGEH